jgi:hypothetical protein
MPLLPVTPHPFPKESVFSWAIRVAESNVVPSPWHIFKLVGFNQGQMSTPTIDTRPLALLVGDTESTLESFGYAKESAEGPTYKFRDQPITVRDLALQEPKICPNCIEDHGYASAHWDLDLVSCCHIHNRRLIQSCPDCGRKLSWFRSSLLRCSCGASFSKAPTEEVSPEEVRLNQLIHQVAFAQPVKPSETNSAYIALGQSPLRYLLRFIHSIGTLSTQGRLVQGKKQRVDVQTLMSAAASVLSSWPESFHNFLEQLTTRPVRETQERRGVLGCINDFSAAVLDRADDRKHGEFCRSEIRKFLANTWDGAIDPGVVRDLIQEGLTPRWIPLTLAAKQLDINKRTLALIMEQGKIRFKIANASSANRILLRSEDLKPEWFAPTILLNVREAASQLRLPVSVLQELRRTGDYVQTYFGATSVGYAQRDVTSLKEAIFAGGKVMPDDQTCGVSVAAAMKMRFFSSSAKAEIVRAIIRGDIRTAFKNCKTPGDLLLHPSDLQGVIDKIKLPENGTMTVAQAGAALHTNKRIVENLVENGYLNSPKHGEVDAASVHVFLDSYVCLNSLLHLKNKIAQAEQVCVREKLGLIVLRGQRRGSTRRFLRKTDLPMIKDLIMSRPTTSIRWSH